MNNYSPFDKDIALLDVGDLSRLINVHEGWYVEYKREVPNAASIAKSISAFANTYGGWLFYGIAEKSKEEPVAGSFPGIAATEVDPMLQRMRQAVAYQINPSAQFDTKVLYGPCDAIALAQDRAVICVAVPWSAEAPHVHKSGQIYRRVADGSEPRPENDRFVLDQLWQRSKAIRDKYSAWHDEDPEFSKDEKDQTFVRLLITPHLWQQKHPEPPLELQHVREILGAAEGGYTRLPFDTVFMSSSDFVGRQCKDNDPHRLGLTWRLQKNLSSDVLIPLPTIRANNVVKLAVYLHGYKNAERFETILRKAKFSYANIADLNYLFNILIGVVDIQRRLHLKAGWATTFNVKVKLLNVWRVCPFIDIDKTMEEFEKNGVPMCLNRVITSFAGSSPESFLPVEAYENYDDEYVRLIVQSTMVFLPVAAAFGISIDVDKGDDDEPYFLQYQDAGKRAMEIQRKRTEHA